MKHISIFAVLMLLCSVSSAQPPNDGDKWYLTVFTSSGSAPCQQLKQDFSTSKHLSPWTKSSHVNFIDINRASQAMRRSAYSVSPRGEFPVIILYPPRSSSKYPYYMIFRQSGYDGDAKKLSHDMYHMGSLFIKTVNEIPRNLLSVGNTDAIHFAMTHNKESWEDGCILCSRNRPFHPRPEPDPEPDDDFPLPVIPDLTPDTIEPEQPETPESPETPEVHEGIPQHPQVTIIYDSLGIGEESRLDLLRRIAVAEVSKFPFSLQGTKARIFDVSSPDAKPFPVGPGDAPAIFVTDHGKILGAVSRVAIHTLLKDCSDADTKDADTKDADTVDEPGKPAEKPPAEKPPAEKPPAEKPIEPKKPDKPADSKPADSKPACECEGLPSGCDCDLGNLRSSLLGEITKIIEKNKPDPVVPVIPTKDRHIVIVVDQKAGYWARLEGEVKIASGYYSAIKIAPPPKFSVPLPQLVMYENGIPVHRTIGLFQVSSDLAQITRGNFPGADQ